MEQTNMDTPVFFFFFRGDWLYFQGLFVMAKDTSPLLLLAGSLALKSSFFFFFPTPPSSRYWAYPQLTAASNLLHLSNRQHSYLVSLIDILFFVLDLRIGSEDQKSVHDSSRHKVSRNPVHHVVPTILGHLCVLASHYLLPRGERVA